MKKLRSVGRIEQLKISDFGSLTPEEIEQLAQELSIDLGSCEKRLKRGDAWQQILLAHLFIDHVLMATIEEAAIKPEALSLDRAGFSAKLATAEAFRLIDPEFLPFAKCLNRIRNSIAHDLSFKITRKHTAELEKLSSELVRYSVGTSIAKEGGTRLYWVLFYNLIDLELYRQKRVEGRLRAKASAARSGIVARTIRDIKL